MTTATHATKADEQTAIEQINAKAQEALARIASRLPEIEIAIRAYEEELAVFPQRKADRTQRLDSERSTLTNSQTAVDKAEAYATVALGTLGEKSSIKAVSKAKHTLGQTQKHFEAMQSMLTKEQDADDAREQELTGKIAALQEEYRDIQAEWQRVESARQQAHAELGAMKATAINDQLNERQAQIDEVRKQLVALQVKQHDSVEEAVKDLAPWSDHRYALRQKYPASDEMASVLEHEIAYINALLTHSQTLPYNDRLYDLLAIPAGELHVQEHLRNNPRSLRARLAELQALLGQHQQSLQR